jgi:predicted O-methyltransferase YrrM
MDEPRSDEQANAWVTSALGQRDPFIEVARASEAHREEHGRSCEVYPSAPGNFLGTLASISGARRILEVGCGLGYGSLWLAHGTGGGNSVETIESDTTHSALAREQIGKYPEGERIRIVEGIDFEVLPMLDSGYDLVFYDAGIPGPELLDEFERLVRPGGLLVTSNLFLGRYVPDGPELKRGAAYRERLMVSPNWTTAFANLKALSIRA